MTVINYRYSARWSTAVARWLIAGLAVLVVFYRIGFFGVAFFDAMGVQGV